MKLINIPSTLRLALPSALAAFLYGTTAFAAYPEKPIQIVVPYAAGSGSDFIARTLADELSKSMGKPVMVINKPGADGRIGTEFVVNSAPDGYTLMVATAASHSANPNLIKNLPYDPVKDFSHIALLTSDPMILAVNPKAGTSLSEFVARARTKELSFGYGSTTSLVATSTFNQLAQITALPVPYKSQPPAAMDAASGQVDYLFADGTSVGALIKSGRLLGFAVTGQQRSAMFPDIPTFAEQGFKTFTLQGWVGLAAPAGTPESIVSKLNAEVRKALTNPEVVAKYRTNGKTVQPNTAAEQTSLVQHQLSAWASRVSAAGLDEAKH